MTKRYSVKSFKDSIIKKNHSYDAPNEDYCDIFAKEIFDPELSYAKVANACGLKSVTCKTMDETNSAIKQSCEDQKKGITTLLK